MAEKFFGNEVQPVDDASSWRTPKRDRLLYDRSEVGDLPRRRVEPIPSLAWMPTLAVRLPGSLDRALRDVAAREGVSISTLVRSAIASKLNEAGVVLAKSPSIESTLEALDRSYEERGWVDATSA